MAFLVVTVLFLLVGLALSEPSLAERGMSAESRSDPFSKIIEH